MQEPPAAILSSQRLEKGQRVFYKNHAVRASALIYHTIQKKTSEKDSDVLFLFHRKHRFYEIKTEETFCKRK